MSTASHTVDTIRVPSWSKLVVEAASGLAPNGKVVAFERTSLAVVPLPEEQQLELPWEALSCSATAVLPDLFELTSHSDLHGAVARTQIAGLTRSTLRTSSGTPAHVLIASLGPESPVSLLVVDTTSVLAEIAAADDKIRTRVVYSNDGDLIKIEGAPGSYAQLGESIGPWAHALINSSDRHAVNDAVNRVRGGEPYERFEAAGAFPGLQFDIVVAASGDQIVIDLCDGSHQHQAIATLARAHTQFNQLSETLPVGVFVVSNNGRMEFHSERLREMFGPRISTGTGWIDVVCPDDRRLFDTALSALPDRRAFSVEVRAERADGGLGWFRLAGSDMRDADGTLKCIVGFVEDISERRDLQQRIEFQATYDDLTALPNRATVIDRLRSTLAIERPGTCTGVLFVDLDGFKLINDTQGHSVGDIVLIEVAQRFCQAVRSRDIIGRFGGDEFIVVAPNLSCAQEAEMLAQRLHDALSMPMRTDGRAIAINASIGIAMSDAGGSTSEQLIGDADIAMYEAKRVDCGNTVVFDAPLRSRAAERFDMTTDLRHARRRRELRLEYQPIINLDTEAIVAVEGLIRWEHPTMGRIAPSVFVPLAEEFGLIADIGEWVVEQACADLDRLRSSHLIGDDFIVSVNASAHQFDDVAMLATSCQAALDRYALSPHNLQFELTESVPLTEIPDAASRIRQLTSYGFGLAIDDFGTGYSSLGYLTMLPFNALKLDQSLIAQLQTGASALAVVDSLTRMSREMGFTIVAEGIETGEQQELLHRAGVQLGQGYHISRPTAFAGLVDKLSV